MRNLFGYAATAVAAGAVSFFAAAGFADQHPESFLGECFHKVRCMCAGHTETVACAATPGIACGHSVSTEAICPTIRFEPQLPDSSNNRLPGSIVINEQAEPEQCEVPEQVRILMKGLARLQDGKDLDTEISAPAAPFMPYCEDDEPAPAVMPYAEERRVEKAGGAFLEFWTSFFRWPGSDAVPECKEDPAIHQQYPGVPESRKPGKAKLVPFEEEFQEVSPLPMSKPDFKQLLKPDGTLGSPKKRSHLDTTECRPSDFGFDNLGLRPF
jgi:hypothetical protein